MFFSHSSNDENWNDIIDIAPIIIISYINISLYYCHNNVVVDDDDAKKMKDEYNLSIYKKRKNGKIKGVSHIEGIVGNFFSR